jgi:hypothetical protein
MAPIIVTGIASNNGPGVAMTRTERKGVASRPAIQPAIATPTGQGDMPATDTVGNSAKPGPVYVCFLHHLHNSHVARVLGQRSCCQS